MKLFSIFLIFAFSFSPLALAFESSTESQSWAAYDRLKEVNDSDLSLAEKAAYFESYMETLERLNIGVRSATDCKVLFSNITNSERIDSCEPVGEEVLTDWIRAMSSYSGSTYSASSTVSEDKSIFVYPNSGSSYIDQVQNFNGGDRFYGNDHRRIDFNSLLGGGGGGGVD